MTGTGTGWLWYAPSLSYHERLYDTPRPALCETGAQVQALVQRLLGLSWRLEVEAETEVKKKHKSALSVCRRLYEEAVSRLLCP